MGVGTAMVSRMSTLLAFHGIWARIRPDNQASIKIAEHAGMMFRFRDSGGMLNYSRRRHTK